MASVLLSPVGNGQQFFDNNGVPLSGGLIYTYQAGSSTLLTTYTTNNGTVANANPIVLDASGRCGEIWMQSGYSYKFVIQTSGGSTLQTLDNLYPILQNAPTTSPALPSGVILLWSGSIGSIPSGYVICDGTNSTPDLRDRFVVAAGNNYSVGQTGGSADAIIVSHTHTATVTDPGHTHTTNPATSYVGTSPQNAPGGSVANPGTPTTLSLNTATTGISVSNASAGVSGTGANNPLYYALAYIMKT